MSPLQCLPSDILVIIMHYLDVRHLDILSRTCKTLHAAATQFGWADHLRLNPRRCWSLSKALDRWDARSQVKYHTLSDRAWARCEFVARPLQRPWYGKLQPLLAISNSRLIVAAGNNLYSYGFSTADTNLAPAIHHECTYTFSSLEADLRGDITGIAFVPDGGLDSTLYVGFEDGRLERVMLPVPKSGQHKALLEASSRYLQYMDWEVIESLSVSDDLLLSLSAAGTAKLFRLHQAAAAYEISSINTEVRSWSSYVSSGSSTPYAAIGTSSATPLVLYSITNSEISPTPWAILQASGKDADRPRSSAVYGISTAPPSSPWGASEQILVSGWYDGKVRVHDLRSSTRVGGGTSAQPAPLAPVLSIYDPWSFEPIYTLDCGGGASAHIAAGSARHSVVAFWDVRSPSSGWSVHAPGNDSSPVYSLILESSRLFGANQSRSFIYDFVPGVTPSTYPRLPVDRNDGLQHKKDWDGVGYYVTKYPHSRGEV
ncbi:hypothetical protein GLOTRDRAFT_121612 [Gloeophyllum trabeum ATCC 11539]|uniref:F-box domain-containing protein n=1 Tax=Gloeophyllum trabeum (strain ATCC 11539 / FP-39264 / Madison 617) TaxID=670483 RepID=S7Q4N4_GLOTA|nr:uncharacterized protein GLOTRDRAFT_121612 [Gloeophyllum trabeum ATCC 11539]EPQ54462.1 hypothetical protein GLOTRDRAFT_121612 [Gloeophyllum trabeum ATCC 11539]